MFLRLTLILLSMCILFFFLLVWFLCGSVSCGIPDFRSENGVYHLASQLDLGLSCPEDLFDLEFFTDDPEPFFKFAKV